MEDIRQDSILAFDTCFTNNHICMLKILLPFCESSLQKYLAVYIHFLELQYTLSNFPRLSKNFRSEKPDEPIQIFDKLLPYCTPKEKQSFAGFRNLFETMENLKNMMSMMELFQGFDEENMYEMFGSMFSSEGGTEND